jgi:hypothetical protein
MRKQNIHIRYYDIHEVIKAEHPINNDKSSGVHRSSSPFSETFSHPLQKKFHYPFSETFSETDQKQQSP